jgi:iron(III) transport system substrate-binding protein
VRDSTGIITARLLAEKANPQADVIWGVAATSLMLLDKQGMLQPYAPRNLAKVRSTMRDAAATPTWVGMDLWSSAVCFNTVEGEKRKLPTPASWADLTRPEFKGAITMPHPASSGTGYLMVAAWLQMMGEDKGWAYMDALHQNIGVYTHSGSKPCRQAGAGEFPVGLSFEYRANKTKKDGAPIDIVFPREGLGWDVEATAIMKTSKKQEAAKALADWAVTPDANKLYAANFAVLALPEAQEKHEFIPADLEKRLARTTSTGRRPIAIAFFPNGAAATKPRRRRSNTPEALRLGGAAPSLSGAARRRTTPARRGGPCAVSLGWGAPVSRAVVAVRFCTLKEIHAAH